MANSEEPDINELFRNLQINVQKNSDILSILKKLCDRLQSEDKEFKITTDIVNQFIILLQLDKNDVSENIAEILATLAKKETQREVLSDSKIVHKLCQNLTCIQSSRDTSNFSLVKQTCRALGNLCYENDKCRKCVIENDGLKVITSTVKQAIALGNTEQAAELRSYSVGLLLNLVAGNEDVDLNDLKSELVDLLCDLLDCGVSSKESESAAIHCLIILGVLADTANEPTLNQRLCNTLVKILKNSSSGELVEYCVELMHSQSEYASVSLNLARAGLCELLIQLLEKHKNLADDVDTKNLFKMACDLIIIILNDDASMELLFDNGKGNVFMSMVNWLSNNVEELQVSGVLAIGNFARADSHCIEMVKQGIDKQLISLLSRNNTDKGDMKLQHALLSALRNLVIPDQNKSVVIRNGLLQTLYPMISVSSYPVVFKLLGTLRIVMDKQDLIAQELGNKKELIQKVVEWSTTDHPGVQGEASRFLAWLIKNCRNQVVTDAMIECKAIPRIVNMIPSDHEVMQNEALLAINILSSIRLKEMEKILLDAKIGEEIVRLINERKLKKEVFANLVTLLRQLSSSNLARRHLRESGIIEVLITFQKNGDTVNEYQKEVKELIKLLESG